MEHTPQEKMIEVHVSRGQTISWEIKEQLCSCSNQ